MTKIKLSFHIVTIAVLILTGLNWVMLQFLSLPNITPTARRSLYPPIFSTPYPYIGQVIFIVAGIWFIRTYRGEVRWYNQRLAVFAMILGSLCGVSLMVIIRLTWNI